MAIFRSSKQKRQPAGEERPRREPRPPATDVVASAPRPPRAPVPGGGRSGGGPGSVIGRSIQVRGEIVARCPLTIEGKVEGRVRVDDHELAVGSSAKLEAELTAREVCISGHVVGNITAREKIEITPTGTVIGDISAPRVTLSDGSTFTGSINRESAPAVMTRGTPTDGERARQAPPAAKDDPVGWTLERRSKDRPWSHSEGEQPVPTSTL